MEKNIAIEFNNVGKQYRLGLVGTGSLQHDLNRWWQTTILGKEDPYLKIGEVNDRSKKGNSDYVWALKDISFKVEQGDVVGIIGKNGAGKSTLLKLLSHITAPTTGDIRYRGRIASLLEVGTGFHPEMTARQNIYMNGSIMGMTRHEITSKLDEIVDFAGIERYLDTPVKRFSSGMTVRLGFAVAAFLEPEILVVDEVLAVGDAEFQKKAIGKMKEVSSAGGRTVLFVSHNMAAVRNLCNNGIVLKNGMIDYTGSAVSCINHYLRDTNLNELGCQWKRDEEERKSSFYLQEAGVYDSNHELKSSLSCDEDIILDFVVSVNEVIPNVYGWFCLMNANTGADVLISDSNDVKVNKLQDLSIGIHTIRLVIPKRSIAAGDYLVKLNFQSDQSFGGFFLDQNDSILKFSVHDYVTKRGDSRAGSFSTLLDWTFVN